MGEYRHEEKYILTSSQIQFVLDKLSKVVSLDKHAIENIGYEVRSIYFDDLSNSSFSDNENGVDERRKWRIRAYNCNSSHVYLELKQKRNCLIKKRICEISQVQYEKLMNGKSFPIKNNMEPLFKQFLIEQKTSMLRPKVMVGYFRIPYVYKVGNCRITIDKDIYATKQYKSFFDRAVPKRLIMEKGKQLIEVKYDEALPDFLLHIIQQTNMRMETFSKYYLCRHFL